MRVRGLWKFDKMAGLSAADDAPQLYMAGEFENYAIGEDKI